MHHLQSTYERQRTNGTLEQCHRCYVSYQLSAKQFIYTLACGWVYMQQLGLFVCLHFFVSRILCSSLSSYTVAHFLPAWGHVLSTRTSGSTPAPWKTTIFCQGFLLQTADHHYPLLLEIACKFNFLCPCNLVTPPINLNSEAEGADLRNREGIFAKREPELHLHPPADFWIIDKSVKAIPVLPTTDPQDGIDTFPFLISGTRSSGLEHFTGVKIHDTGITSPSLVGCQDILDISFLWGMISEHRKVPKQEVTMLDFSLCL